MLSDTTKSLASFEPQQVLVAAWDAFDVVGRVADAIAWEPEADELHALAAAQACAAGRALLPLPEFGRPMDTPAVAAGPEGLAPWVDLLHQVSAALVRLNDEQSADARAVLTEAARHAAVGAEALAAVRRQ
ncbi:hypothetical protein ABZ135_31295 [Streptomyces sp. NPDC006339]|uniref:hypothetical protein n=1 Tax=Streptomyces sp. NPDC006339 TaxID=3156755 RepID=UPI0033A91427